jgi:predicted PurR-regulated permease PerM
MTTPTDRDRIAHLVYYAAILLIGYLCFQIVQPFLVSLGWAGVLAVCMYPVQVRLAPRLGRSWAAGVSTILVLLLIVVPVWLIVRALVSEGAPAVAALQDAVQSAKPERLVEGWEWLVTRIPFLAPDRVLASVSDAGQQLVGALASRSGAVIGGAAMVVVNLSITLFALYFFLRDARAIVAVIRGLMPFDTDQRDRIVNQVGDLIFASVTAGLAVAGVQGLLGGLAFWLLGLHAPVVWGTIMAFFALIPVAGAWVIWAPVAAWLIVTGDVTRGIILIVIGVGLVGMADNVLRPLLLSGRAAMNALVMFVALLGGVAAFGLIGLVFGPVVVAVALALLEAYLNPTTAPARSDSESVA